MGEWVKIEFEMDKLDQGCQGKDLRYSLGKKELSRQEKIREVARNVHTYDNVIDYLSAMAMASKK